MIRIGLDNWTIIEINRNKISFKQHHTLTVQSSGLLSPTYQFSPCTITKKLPPNVFIRLFTWEIHTPKVFLRYFLMFTYLYYPVPKYWQSKSISICILISIHWFMKILFLKSQGTILLGVRMVTLWCLKDNVQTNGWQLDGAKGRTLCVVRVSETTLWLSE